MRKSFSCLVENFTTAVLPHSSTIYSFITLTEMNGVRLQARIALYQEVGMLGVEVGMLEVFTSLEVSLIYTDLAQ